MRAQLRAKYGDDWERISRMSIIEESGGDKTVRMAYLAVVASHSVNGVAAIHSEIIKHTIFKDFYDVSAVGRGTCRASVAWRLDHASFSEAGSGRPWHHSAVPRAGSKPALGVAAPFRPVARSCGRTRRRGACAGRRC